MNVYLTADVEIWCDGWIDIDKKFPEAFQRYINGRTPSGNYGLEYQLKTFQEHDLKCTFFVEPLFSLRFGLSPLKEIVDLIQSYGQSVELHIHTEWLDEANEKLFPDILEKRQHISYFNLQQQIEIIATGKRLLHEAGVKKISAFRAGSFAFNQDTLKALVANEIYIDASYNELLFGKESGVANNKYVPFNTHGLTEFPMTIFDDSLMGYRHAQLTACSYKELCCTLKQALERDFEGYTFLFHNFELLNTMQTDIDTSIIRRFNKLCAYLKSNNLIMPTAILADAPSPKSDKIPSVLKTNKLLTMMRVIEQLYRKIKD